MLGTHPLATQAIHIHDYLIRKAVIGQAMINNGSWIAMTRCLYGGSLLRDSLIRHYSNPLGVGINGSGGSVSSRSFHGTIHANSHTSRWRAVVGGEGSQRSGC